MARAALVATLLVLFGLPVVGLGAARGPAGGAVAAATDAGDPVVVAAGDIACAPGDPPDADECRQMDTADLITRLNPEAVLPMGDLQYDRGTAAEFAGSYDPSWGRAKAISYPVPGNHEYDTAGAAGYFGYFGSRAGDPSRGYYSFDIGAWHVIALNSNCSDVPGGCGRGSPQETWLRADLAAHPTACTMAFWHHPRFSAGSSSSSVGPFWDALYAAGADLVLAGHSHVYEHYAPQSPSGAADPRGMRQFVVGTGGVNFGSLGSAQPNTVTRQNNTFGVLRLVLRATSYEWEFVPIAGSSFVDTGSASCHSEAAPEGPAAPTGLTVTGTTASSVALGWTTSNGPDVAGYRVYRDGSASPLNGSLVTGTSFTDTTVTGDRTYSYRVTAVNAAGIESAPSGSVNATTPGGTGAGATAVDVPVRTSADDAEERVDTGAVTLGSGDLNLGADGARPQVVGMRFTGVSVPAGATISSAWVQFQADEATSTGADLTVAGVAADSPPAFTTVTAIVSGRSRTAATVHWVPAAWPTVGARGADQRSPDLSAVVQEIVSRPGWAAGNAVALVVTGTGTRIAESFDGGSARAPVLHVEYTTGSTGPINTAPVVSAGPDVSVTLPNTATLAGSVTDDRLPNPPATVTAAWSVVSGPGPVTFGDPAAPATTATFGAAGDYVLRLTGSDGALQRSDDVAVRVTAGATNLAPLVSAGPDVSVTLPNTATLAGSVTDDGLPNPPATVTAAWSVVSGPGPVTFGDPAAPATTATFGAAGDYVLRLTGSDGALQRSDDVAVRVLPAPMPGSATLDVPVRVSSDDAEERAATGAVSLGSGDLNLGADGANLQVCGMRFTGVTIPRGATITTAWVQFQVDEASTATTALTVRGQPADTAAEFTVTAADLSRRPTTAASVAWTPVSWPVAGARTVDQRTPDLAPVLQEIVSQGGWASGSAVVLLVTGTGERTAESVDGGAVRAPVLHVEYTVAG